MAGKNRNKSRTKTRRLLVQALYQAQLSGHSFAELQEQFAGQDEYLRVDSDYFANLLTEIDTHRVELDAAMGTYGHIPAEQLDPVEHAVLWVALAELRFRTDVPPRVVINEAIELTKTFGAEGGHKYINGVLDKAASEALKQPG
jgi:N utilization substance protein B